MINLFRHILEFTQREFAQREFTKCECENIKDIKNKHKEIKKRITFLQLAFSFSAYSIIAHGYHKAGYYPLTALTLFSMLILIIAFVVTQKKYLSSKLLSIVYIYMPIANILTKDAFFLLNGNPNINTIFLHTHFMLLLFIAFGGTVSNRRNILYIGLISVIWIWLFTICINDTYLWSLVFLDSVFFIGITIITYTAFSWETKLNLEICELSKTLDERNEELNKLINAKNWMLNMILHDIKSPINRLLSAAKKNVVQKEEITQASKHILSIVDNILEVYKMEESKMPMNLSLQNIDTIINKASHQVRYLLDEKKIVLAKQISANSIVKVDVQLLIRVFVNLLNNSIKYSKANGRIEISVTLKQDKVRVEIRDNGKGIAPEHINHIFEKYYQVNALNLGSTRSTGIGLTFCKLVIEAHNGEIGAKSILNHGTVIWFELPVQSEAELICEEKVITPIQKHKSSYKEEEPLLQYKLKLANLAVYQTSEILDILKLESTNDSIKTLYWKEEIFKSSVTGNVEYFNQLKKIPVDLAKSRSSASHSHRPQENML